MVTRPLRALRFTIGVAIASAAAAAIALACGTGDIGDLTAGRADSSTAIVEAGVDAPADALVCIHASAPTRPTGADAVNVPDVVFALSNIRFDTGDEDAGLPKPIGLDLDQTCTCLETDSCKAPDSGMPRACDGPNGVDNVAGPLLAGVIALGKGLGPDVASRQISIGAFSILLLLQGWNGLPDDPNVMVGIAVSNGVEGSQGDAATQPPKLDGTDVWTVTPESILDGVDLNGRDCRALPIATCLPLRADTHGYVKGGVLVAHLDVPLPILTSSGFFPIDFIGATVSAKMTTVNGVPHLDGEIAGRWPVDELLPTFARVHNPITDIALCKSDAGLDLYQTVRATVCNAVDLTANPTLDRTGAPCNAISNAVSFSAVKATTGTVYQSNHAIPNDCPEFTDSCPK